MIIRNSEGIIKIISRNDCKDEKIYNKKIYKIMNDYAKNYKMIKIINPEMSQSQSQSQSHSHIPNI